MSTAHLTPPAPTSGAQSRSSPAPGSGRPLCVLSEEKIPVRGRAKHRTKHFAHDAKTGELITSSFQMGAIFAVLRLKGYNAREWLTPQNGISARNPT